MQLKAISPLLLALAVPAAHASDDNFSYIGLLYGHHDVSNMDLEFNTVGAVLGYGFNQYVAVEGRFGTGVSDATVQLTDYDGSIYNYEEEVRAQLDLLLKFSLPITNQFSVYAIGGLAANRTNLSETEVVQLAEGADPDRSEYSDSSSSISRTYGAGVSYKMEQLELTVEYKRWPPYKPNPGYLIKEDWNSINIGLNYHF